MIFVAIIIIAIISVLWSLWSLKGFLKSARISKGVKKELSLNRVIFRNDHILSHSSESSDASSPASSASGLE